jgi:DNA-binding transcriptional LysR family regulator
MRKLSIPQMEALLAIAKFGSFNAAASRMHVTQPTISMRVRELENALGTRLFVRAGRGVTLTPSGMLAVRYAEQSLGLLEELEARLGTGTPLNGTLRLGSSEMIAMTSLPEVVQQLESRYSGLQIDITVANSFTLHDLLAGGKLDICLLTHPGTSRLVRLEPIAMAQVGWLGSHQRLPAGTMLSPTRLAGQNLLSVPPPSPLHEMLVEWCLRENAPPPILNTCSSLSIIAGLVRAGLAVSLLPLCVLASEIEQGSVICYPQQRSFEPLRICVAFPRMVGHTELDCVVRIATDVMTKHPSFAPIANTKG